MTATKAAPGPALEVGNQLVGMCRKGDFKGAIAKLYAKDIVSVEPVDMTGQGRETRGLESVKAKNQAWEASNEVHSAEVLGPFPHDDRFAVVFRIDVTPKAGPMKGARMKIEEVGLYTVKNGKIAREEFFYDMG